MIGDRDDILLVDLLFNAVLFDVFEKALFIWNFVVFSKVVVNEKFVYDKLTKSSSASTADRFICSEKIKSILAEVGVHWWYLSLCFKSFWKYWPCIWVLPITILSPDDVSICPVTYNFEVDSSSDQLVDEPSIISFIDENFEFLSFLEVDSTNVVTC